ncbi:MAG: glycosyltransferase [Bacteroidetes bacterium]|nr:glycosyltransferase [Bacteroidota bacterium]
MHSIFSVYQICITVVTACLFAVALYNVRRFVTLPVGGGSPTVRVSVLVPARNEERCIEACVTSLCLQDHPNMEVIVLDDQSTDGTPHILRRLQERFPDRLRILTGTDLPAGWVGKSWACHTLSQQATGDVLLFTDADTTHQPHCVSSAVAMLDQRNLDMFSLIPHEVMHTAAEHIVIPMVHVLYFAYVPNDLIMNDPRVSLSAANGQFMCFRRSSYEMADGHAAVHNALVEDVFMAKHMKTMGMRIALVDGTHAVSCRMYTSAADVTAGFSKNFFPATSYNLPLTLLFLFHLATTFITPLAFITVSPLHSLLQLSMAAGIRAIIAHRFGMPRWHMFLQPITAAWSIVIGINSIRWAYSKQGSRWKGRSYSRQD